MISLDDAFNDSAVPGLAMRPRCSPPMMALDMLFTGDLVLDVPDPDHWLQGIAAATRCAQLTIGHLEVPHTLRGDEMPGDIPAPGANPDHLDALQRAGFDGLTLAGNHIADCGHVGISDTIARLDQLGIRHCGAGQNLADARRPAILAASDISVALLSYNCVGPELSWATAERPGCAYVRVETQDHGRITPTAPLAAADPASLAQMARDIDAARQSNDLIVVALHKGIVHTPARLAPYEREVAHAAIDAGATIVISHHAHLLRGIEIYRGKPIYHGLGNGCVVTNALAASQSHEARAAWAKRRRELFGFEPDPAYPLAPFHPEAIHALMARVVYHPGGQLEAGFIPVYVEPPGRPVLADATFSRQVMQYVQTITKRAFLPEVSMTVRDDMVLLA